MPKVLDELIPESQALREQIAELAHDWEYGRNWGTMSDADKAEYRGFADRVLALPGLQRLCLVGRIRDAAESCADILEGILRELREL